MKPKPGSDAAKHGFSTLRREVLSLPSLTAGLGRLALDQHVSEVVRAHSLPARFLRP